MLFFLDFAIRLLPSYNDSLKSNISLWARQTQTYSAPDYFDYLTILLCVASALLINIIISACDGYGGISFLIQSIQLSSQEWTATAVRHAVNAVASFLGIIYVWHSR